MKFHAVDKKVTESLKLIGVFKSKQNKTLELITCSKELDHS